MKKCVKSLISMIIALTMLMPTALPVFADNSVPADSLYGFVDFPTGWSKTAMAHAVENGLIYGKTSERIYPHDNLTRAEMATIINRAFGSTVTKDISAFADVSQSQWYYNDIKKAYNMQTLYGDAGGTMRPDAFIIREEAIAIVARAMVLSGYAASNLDKFKDKADISDWAIDPLASMAACGYVNGDEKSNMNPKAFITREEFAQLLHNIIKHYYNEEDGITTFKGNVMVNKPFTSLSNLVINGDLILGDGVGTSTIVLKNVKVTGRILIRGATHISFENSNFEGGVTVKNVNDVVHFDHFSDEVHFNYMKDHTEVTFKKKTTGGGGTPPAPTPTTANYTVEHYQEALDGSFAVFETETLSGTVGLSVTAVAKTYEGFSEDTLNPSRVATGTVATGGTLVLKLYYTRNTYTVTFDFGSGATLTPGTQTSKTDKYGATVVLPTTGFSNGALNFGGWYTQPNGVGEQITQIVIGTSNTTIYAYWTSQNTYKVEHYQENIDGSYSIVDADTQILAADAGTNVTAVAKTYTGFYENTSHAQRVPSGIVLADNSLVLKLYYQRNTYTFTFNAAGGSISGTPKTVYKFGETLVLPTPTKGTDSFGGWWTLPNGTGTKIENTSVLGTDITSAAITVYAHWIPAAPTTGTFTVEHYQEDFYGNWMLYETDLEQTIAIGTVLKAQDYKNEYAGFTVDLANSPNVTVAAGNNTLAIYYTRNEYTVTYNFNDGVPATVHTVTLKYGQQVDLAYLPTVTVPGKFFAGWYNAPAGGTQYPSLWVPAENITIYAQWSDNPGYAIEYWLENADDDEYTCVIREVRNDVTEGQTATIPAEIFEHFTEIVHPQTNTSGVVTATPQLTLKRFYNRARYTITFDYQGADGGVIIPSKEYKHEQTIELPFPTKTGYMLEGWFTGINGTGEKIFDGSQITSGRTLYAYWVPAVVEFKVEHYKQELDGTYSATPSQTEIKEDYTGIEVDAVDHKLDFTGFIFDGSSPSVIVSGDGSTALKIYYIRETYTVSFDTGLGTAVSPVVYKYGQAFTEPGTTRPGYEVEGWYTTSTFDAATKVSAGDLAGTAFTSGTLYANWVALPSDFTVKHHKQNIDDDLYTEAETETKSALTDSTVSADTYKKQYTGFAVDLLSSVDKTVSADGSTVLNIYYLRNKHSITYNYENDVTAPLVVPDVKYDAQVNLAEPDTSLWPAGKYFTGWSLTLGGEAIVAYPMPDEDLNLYAVWGNNPPYQLQYLFENADDADYTVNPAYSTAKNDVVEGQSASIPELSTIPTGFEAYPTHGDTLLSGTVTETPQLVLKRFYKRLRFTVELNYNGADGNNTVLTQEYKYEQTENLPAPTKTGYIFAGWFTALDNTGILIADGSKITSGGTLYAKWTPDVVEFKVEHYKQNIDGTYPDSTTLTDTKNEYTETIVKPEDYDIAIEGFTFDATRNSGIAIAGNGTTVLKVYYTRNEYTVTYNYGEAGGSNTATLKYEANISLAPPTATVAGKYFAGWYDAPTGGLQITSLTMPVGGTTIYAYWSVNPSYTVKHYKQALDGTYPEDGAVIEYIQAGLNETVTATAKTFTGFSEDTSNPSRVPNGTNDGNLTLKLYYTRNQYTLTFEYNGATGNNTTLSQSYRFGETIALPTPTKGEQFAFGGWFTGQNGTGTQITNLSVLGTDVTNSNTTLYAKWIQKYAYTVKYLKQNVDGVSYTEVAADTKTFYGFDNEVVSITNDKTYEGFEYDTGSITSGVVSSVTPLVIELKFVRNSYNVNFDFGGATTSLPSSAPYKYEELVVLPTTGFTNGVKTFVGWFDAQTGGNKVTQITVPLGGTTVYARWADTYFTVKHLIENIDGTDYSQHGASRTEFIAAGEAVKPETYAILIDGFAFDTTRNDEITVSEDNTTVLNVYYTRNEYTVTYNYNESATPTIKTETFKYQQNVDLSAPIITVPNKFFAGWYDAPTGGLQITSLTMPVGGTTIYAQWSDNPGYAIEYWLENADNGDYTREVREVKNDVQEGQTATIPTRNFDYFNEITHPQTTISGTVSSTEELVLKRYYQRIRFSVDLEYNGATGGNTTLSQDYKYEQTENLPTPTKTGYEFAGWFTAPDDTGVLIADGSKMPLVDRLYAKWTPALVKIIVEHYKQKVETDDFDAPIVDNQQKAYTESTVSNKMTTYDGFSVDLNAAGTVNSATVLPDGTTVLKYYYTRNKYNVIYDYNNNEHPGTLVQTLKFEASVDLSVEPTFTVTNKFFAGWYNAATGGTQVTSLTVPVGGATLYAKWEDNPGYAYEYWLENIEDNNYTRVERTVYNDKTVGTYVGPIPTKTYDGFVENEAKAVLYGNVLQDGSLALKRFYDRKRYTVTFDYRGATAGITSKEYKYGQSAGLPAPSREFYDFKGWFTEVNGGGTKVESTDLAGVKFESGTLYAFWEFNWDGEVKFTANVTEQDSDNDEFSIIVDVSNNPVGIAKYDLSLSFDNTNVVAILQDGKVVTDLKADGGFGADVASITSNADGITTNDDAALLNTITVSWENATNKSGNANLFKIRFKIVGTKGDEDHEAPALMRFRMMRAISLIPGLESLPFTLEATTVAVKSDETDNNSYIELEKETEGDSLSPYMVEHYKENADNDGYTKVFTQYGHAVLGSVVWADLRNAYLTDGFTPDYVNSIDKAVVTESGAVLKLYYLRPRFTVTFDYQNATTVGIPSVSLKAGALVYNNLPSESTFSKTDYNFSGWYTEANGQGTKVDASYKSPFEDVTLYAYWTQTPYKVEHYLEELDGNFTFKETEEAQAKAGTLVTATAKSYLGFDAPAVMPSAVVAEDGSTVIKVNYTRKTYTINYNFGDGYADGSYEIEFKYGQSIELAKGKNDNGLVLGGWYTKANGQGIKITTTADIDDILTNLAGDTITLYANWVEEIANYTIEFYKQSIDVSNYYPQVMADTITLQGVVGSFVEVDPNDPAIKNKYVGFELNEAISFLKLKLEETGTRLRVYYDRNEYTLTLNFGEGATVDGSINKTPSVKYEATYTLPQPEDGFSNGNLIFVGWFDAPTGGNKVTEVTMGASDTEVYARWAEDVGVYTVEFYQQNLDGSDYTIVATDTQTGLAGTIGNTVSVDATTAEIKNKYEGFTINTSISKLSETLTKTGTVLKVYYDRNEYTLIYNYSEADKTGIASQTFKYGQTITFPEESTFEKSDYKFVGWYTTTNFADDELLDTSFAIEDVVDVANGDTEATIYVKWSEVFTVTFREGAKIGTYTVDPEVSSTVPYSAFPYDKLKERYKNGYFENASVSSVYAGNEYQHTFEGDWYYTDENGNDALFTDETVVDRDITVRYKFRYVRLELFVEKLSHNLVLEVPFEESTRVIDSIKDELFVNQEKILLLADEIDARQKFLALNLKLVDFLADKGLEIDPGQIFADDGEILKQHIKFNAFAYLNEESLKTVVVNAIRTTFKNDPLRMRGVIDEMMTEQDKDVVDLMDTVLVSMLSGDDAERIKGIIADAVETAVKYDENDTEEQRAEKDEFRQRIKGIIVSRLDTEADPEFEGQKVVTDSVKEAVYSYFMDETNDTNIRKTIIDLINDAYEADEDGEPANPEIRAFVKGYITDYFKSATGSAVFDNLILELGETLDADNPDDKPVIDLIHDVLAKDDRNENGLTYLEELVDRVIRDLHNLAEDEENTELYDFVVDAITEELMNDASELETLIRTIGDAEPADLKAVLATAMEDDGVFETVVKTAVSNSNVFADVINASVSDTDVFEIMVRQLCETETDFYNILVDIALSSTTLTNEVKNAVVNNDDALISVLKEVSTDDALKADIVDEILTAADAELKGKLTNPIDSSSEYYADVKAQALIQAKAEIVAGGITESSPLWADAVAQAETEITNLLATGIAEGSEYWNVAYNTAKSILRQEIETNFDSKLDEIKTDANLKAQVRTWVQGAINKPEVESAIKDLTNSLATSTDADDIALKASIIETVITTVKGAGFDTTGLASSITTELNKAENSTLKEKVAAKAIAVLNDDAYADVKTDLIADVLAEVLPDSGAAAENKADIVSELIDQLVGQVNQDDGQPGGIKDTVISVAIDAVVNDSHVNEEAVAIINKLIDESPEENPDGTPTFKEKCITNIITYVLNTPTVKQEVMQKVVSMIETPYNPEIPGAIDYKAEAIEFAFNYLGTHPVKRTEIAGKLLDSILDEEPVDGVYVQRENLANDVKTVMFESSTIIRNRILDVGFEQMFAGDIEGFVSLALDELIGDDAVRREMIIAVISTENGRRSILDILFDELERDPTFIDDMVDIAMKGKYGDLVADFVHQVINEGRFEINPDNVQIADEIVLPMLDSLTLDTVLERLPERITDVLPTSKIEGIFNKFKTKARELLVEAIKEGKEGNSKYINIMIDHDIDVINDILVPAYNKVFPKVVDKAEDFYYYNENVYLKAIVDMIDPTVLLDNSKPASSGGTGYRLRSTDEYYVIFRNVLTLADDAADWYLNNISDEQINGAIDKVVGKVKTLLTKLNSFVGNRIPVSKIDTVENYTKKILDKRERAYNVSTAGAFERFDNAYDKFIGFVKEKTGVDISKSTTIEVTFDGSRLAVNDKDVNIDNYDISISVKGYTFKLDSHSITVAGKTVDISRFVQKAADIFGTRSVTVKIAQENPYSYGAYVGNNYIKLSAEYK
ncbi:MAG: InlB B-repeat-containing protein [Clostridia bacterium]|nr:InlB B-repeat-containing protein [Clostridia bacterium]